MRVIAYLGCMALLYFSSSALADKAFTQRPDVQKFIKTMISKHDYSEQELISILDQVKLQPQIYASMDMPYEKKTWDVYKALFLTSERLQGGLEFWRANQANLEKAQARYGVPPEIIIAILGVETMYGPRQGENRVLDTLASLAFGYPKRAPYFTHELEEFLVLCNEQKMSPTTFKGSYAGAIGKPQFMPSSYRNYAVDFDHNGTSDLVNSDADTIGSIANFFNKHGWQANQGIAQHASIHGSKYKKLILNPRYANYRYSQLEKYGVTPTTASHNHPKRAGVIELTTDKGKEYWLAYPNFFVITRYNNSPQYALVVYLLAQHLKMQWNERNTKKHRAYV